MSFISTAQSELLEIPEHGAAVDTTLSIIVARAPLPTINAGDLSGITAVVAAGDTFQLVATPNSFRYDSSYLVVNDQKEFTLYFTQLPLFIIDAQTSIRNEPKVPAVLSYSGDEQTFTSFIGIEYRGSFSLRFPKKSFDLEFWEDPAGDVNRDVTFGDLRDDDDWVLDALYNEPLRVNSFVSHQLWLDVHQLYYAEDEPEALPGARVMLSETFVNGRYYGLTMLSEQVDRKQLKLKKIRNDEIRGELFFGVGRQPGNDFRQPVTPPNNNTDQWEDFELKYPDHKDTIRFNNLHALVDLAISSDDSTFRSDIGTLLNLDNAIDYLLFINVIGGVDNRSKNIYTARYNTDEPYFFLAWDLDTSFGNRHDGTDLGLTDGLMSNGLLERLIELNPENFNQRMCDRYNELRDAGIISAEQIIEDMEKTIGYLNANRVYEREQLAWPGSLDIGEAQLEYNRQWNRFRIDALDDYICGLAVSTTQPVARTRFSVYPNPTTGDLTLSQPFDQRMNYRLLDLQGRTLHDGILPAGDNHISLPRVRPGMYVLQIGTGAIRLMIN